MNGDNLSICLICMLGGSFVVGVGVTLLLQGVYSYLGYNY